MPVICAETIGNNKALGQWCWNLVRIEVSGNSVTDFSRKRIRPLYQEALGKYKSFQNLSI